MFISNKKKEKKKEGKSEEQENTLTKLFYRVIDTGGLELQNTFEILYTGNFYVVLFEAMEHDKK